MAFTQMAVQNTKNPVSVFKEESIALPSSATIGYSSEIDFLELDRSNQNKYITIVAKASAVTGTNLDIALYGAWTKGGTKFLLKDAIVTDIDNTTKQQQAVVDLNAYPAAFYYLSHTADADEHLNNISYYIIQ